MDLISVIVPVYNVEKYLVRCVQSIQKQTYQNLEIILVDDGSKDNSAQLCNDFAKNDTRIKVVHKENGGLGFARNSGLSIATGEFVLFVDSDDFIDDNHIENLYNCLAHDFADTVIGSLSYKKSDNCIIKQFHNIKEGLYENDDVLNDILLSFIGADINCKNDVWIESSVCTNLYSKKIIDTNKIEFTSERQSISEDLFFNLKYFFCAKKVVVTNECGYYYCENIESITRKYDFKRFDRTLNFYSELQRQVELMGLQNKVEKRADRTFLLDIRFLIRLIVMSNMTRKEKKAEIKRVVDNMVVQQVVLDYPTDTFVFAIRLFCNLLKKRKYGQIYLITRYRQTAKKNKLLSKILKVIGIGKNKRN